MFNLFTFKQKHPFPLQLQRTYIFGSSQPSLSPINLHHRTCIWILIGKPLRCMCTVDEVGNDYIFRLQLLFLFDCQLFFAIFHFKLNLLLLHLFLDFLRYNLRVFACFLANVFDQFFLLYRADNGASLRCSVGFNLVNLCVINEQTDQNAILMVNY